MKKLFVYIIAFLAFPLVTIGQKNSTEKKQVKSVMVFEKNNRYQKQITIGLAGSDTVTIYLSNGVKDVVILSSEYAYYAYNTHKFDQPTISATMVGKNITAMDCNANINSGGITNLDISKNAALEELSCWGSGLTSLDVSKNTKLTMLKCNQNELTNLDVSKNTALVKLYCHENELSSLDVSKNTALTELFCGNVLGKNKLTSLDVSKNTKLTILNCEYNPLKDLDVSKNTVLKELYCNNNQLKDLDVSKNTKLIKLDCSRNNLSEEALNALFKTLHNNHTEDKKIIFVYGNPGAKTCDKTIAEEKGWEVIVNKEQNDKNIRR